MFAWTWISIIIYLGYFFLQTFLTDLNDLAVPDIPQIFVYLMGLRYVIWEPKRQYQINKQRSNVVTKRN